jgi:hypothetical protein
MDRTARDYTDDRPTKEKETPSLGDLSVYRVVRLARSSRARLSSNKLTQLLSSLTIFLGRAYFCLSYSHPTDLSVLSNSQEKP